MMSIAMLFKQQFHRGIIDGSMTLSLETGYRLSPHGEAFLRRHPKG